MNLPKALQLRKKKAGRENLRKRFTKRATRQLLRMEKAMFWASERPPGVSLRRREGKRTTSKQDAWRLRKTLSMVLHKRSTAEKLNRPLEKLLRLSKKAWSPRRGASVWRASQAGTSVTMESSLNQPQPTSL